MNHCCVKMNGVLKEYNSPLSYVPYLRRYYLEYPPMTQRKKNVIAVAEVLLYCPWCGKKFPTGLSDEWADIVEEKFGVKDILDKEEIESKVPEEYLTDQWWKDRGV